MASTAHLNSIKCSGLRHRTRERLTQRILAAYLKLAVKSESRERETSGEELGLGLGLGVLGLGLES